ncbi:zinc finger protein 469 [Gadus morhua]|uniref:zinc finger protein 469 n=1 Tax=Gadus morhua TaxID=8049 RepID=UPI0011B47448|nr:zinc finger protein 469 [Gadus morhua]
MAGEAQHSHAVKELDAESKLQDAGTSLEKHSDKTKKHSLAHFPSTGNEARPDGRGAKTDKLEKERDCTQQREAVIRPQKAGKIDFRSLQNRPKCSTDRPWPSGKSSPQSPSGKGRSRDKAKRSGKSERGNPQQLYRLSITNPRSNPTIGIAYPQQKVSPPKKLEASRGPVSGSYRFHVPSIPEREAELHQEDLSYNRCFQEASPNLTSPSYTSQTPTSTCGTSAHQHSAMTQQQQQQSAAMENISAQPNSQQLLADFQLSCSNAWPSPERIFNGANYGISSQKSTTLSEVNKAGVFASAPFQYGYQFLEDSSASPFSCEQNSQSQDFTDSSHVSAHVNHTSFSFAMGGELTSSNTQFCKDPQQEERTCYPTPLSSQYTPVPPGAASSLLCPRSQSEDSTSSDSSGSSTQHPEQGKNTLQKSTEDFGQANNGDLAIDAGGKSNGHPKDTGANQRALIQGSVHHSRSNSQGPSSQLHFANKTYQSSSHNNIHLGSGPFDKKINNKVHNRIPHSTYLSVEQQTIPFADMNEKFQFQDQRPNSSKNGIMPWQQLRQTSSQNKIELSRQLNNQKLAYMVSPSDWQDDCKSHKNAPTKTPNSFQNNKTNDVFSNQRPDAIKHGSSNAMPNYKAEANHAQVCEPKNKQSRNYSYPPLQVAPVGRMMVSPYESPLPSPLLSPVHNPTSSSTCSSLSPASTSPVNHSSEDGPMSKTGVPPTFYHQHQTKTQLPSDHLGNNSHHFHSEVPRNMPYGSDRGKDDMLSYLHNGVNPKNNMDGNKGFMDSFGLEHHQPPPPYSAHQLLATSLATANLDQLDVVLTCKQCDQNFNNLASFLGHKQYCSQHSFSHIDLKDISKMEDGRKFHADPSKVQTHGANTSIPRCPSDLHLSLLGLNKNGELMCDGETKGDHKEDQLKLSLFSGSGNLPVPLPELEMEDAKLDSLITEALNGLGYQSDNAEIDSSFIDAFADDDLTTIKTTSNKQSLKNKESIATDCKSKTIKEDRNSTESKYLYDSNDKHETDKYTEIKFEKMSLNMEKDEKMIIKKETSPKQSQISPQGMLRERDIKETDASKQFSSEDFRAPRLVLSSKFAERCGLKGFQDSSVSRASTQTQSQPSTATQTSPPTTKAIKENKRKRSSGGTWSKELIHKIVQQKNKLHKLHVKGTKNLQFSLVMDKVTPSVQNPAFGEYDYVSDADDECEPVKIATQGRLSQSSRCKYTYTKESKWRARGEREQAAWRHESKECFEVKKSEAVSLQPEKYGSHQKVRRRDSRSSTSSDLSTSVSVSSDNVSSPKSTDRTDSDCEKRTEMQTKEFPEQRGSSPHKSYDKTRTSAALSFTKSSKMENADQSGHSSVKDGSKILKSSHSSPDIADMSSLSSKANNALKNHEKCKNPLTISKSESHSREIGTFSYDMNTSQRTDETHKDGLTAQSCHAHIEQLQLDSPQSVTVNKEDLNHEKERGSEGIATCKINDSPGQEATQAKFTNTDFFDKHSEDICKEEDAVALGKDFAPKPPSLCSSFMDDVCLSPPESHDSLLQKDTSHLMPYPLDQDNGLMKSPLSFDTSSVFGDLTVAGFDNSLYSDIPLQKEGFSSIENTLDKKEAFDSSFSPFLEQREWSLMVDVSPVLPEEISQYKGDEVKSNENKSDFNHVPLSLPDKIMDYSANLNSCASEDELEIKRIVSELENQLQTTKIQSPALLPENTRKHLQMSKFSPLRLIDDSDNDGTGLDIHCPVQSLSVPVSSLSSEHFTDQVLPWSSPFQFDLIEVDQNTPTHNEPGPLEHFSEREDEVTDIGTSVHSTQNESALLQISEHTAEHTNCDKEKTLTETKEEILEEKRYTENLIKSLEVISDSIFKEESIISEKQEMNVSPRKGQLDPEIECQLSDAIDREDHSEGEVITETDNILMSPNIIEQKQAIEFILNESQSLSLSNTTEPIADGIRPIVLQSSEPLESNNNGANTDDVSLQKDITLDSNTMESAYGSGEMEGSDVVQGTCANSNALDNLNKLFKSNMDDDKHSAIDSQEEEEEAVKGITSDSDAHSPSADNAADAEKELSENIEDVKETSLLQRASEFHADSAHLYSTFAEQQGLGTSEHLQEDSNMQTTITKQEDFVGHVAHQNYSHTEMYSAVLAAESPLEVVTTEKLYSPILMETNAECQGRNSPEAPTTEGESSMLMMQPQFSDIQKGPDYCKVNPPQTKSDVQSNSIQEQVEELPTVEDSGAQLPQEDLVASLKSSPCSRNMDAEHIQCTSYPASPANLPIIPISPVPSLENVEMQENTCQSQSNCDSTTIEQEPLPNTPSSPFPSSKGETEHIDEAEDIDQPLTTAAEMEYTLISPPHLDLGINGCKTLSDETSSAEPLPPSTVADPPEASDDVTKRDDTLYDFRLSPLDYNCISNDPPQLKHYDYIPISPENDAEDKEMVQSPRKIGEPCELRIDPALMSIKNTPDEGTEEPSKTDSQAQLILPDEPQGSDDSQCLKYPCIALDFPPHNKCTDSSSDVNTTVEVDHNTVKSIDPVNVDVMSQAGSGDDSALCMQETATKYHREDTSDGLFALKPLIICEKVDALQKQLAIENKLQKTIVNHLQGDASPKMADERSNMQQGKALCDICSMCFRTVPGLKRHKAMKHSVKADKNIILDIPNHQRNILSSKPPSTTEKRLKDNSQRCFQNKIHGLSKSLHTEINDAVIPLNTSESDMIIEHKAPESAVTLAADEITNHKPSLSTKVKKMYKARKNKNSEVSDQTDSFSDELLKILKTDILQAITPEFQNHGIQELSESSEAQIKINNLLNKTITETQEFPNCVASNCGLDSLTKNPTKDANLSNEISKVKLNKTDTDGLECRSLNETVNGEESSKDIREDCGPPHKETTEESCELSVNVDVVEEKKKIQENKEVPEKKVAQEVLQTVLVKLECEKTRAPSEEADDPLSAPVKGFLDDDATFSQLFPRDEDTKRKKPPRVYSKKNKRQKLSPDTHTLQDCPPSQDQCADNQTDKTLNNSQRNHCEYETISIDDAIMLNMCHNSSLKGDPKTASEINQSVSDHEKIPDNHQKPVSNHLSPIEGSIDKSLVERSSLSDNASLPAEQKVSSDPIKSKEDVQTTQCSVKPPQAPHPPEPSVTDNVPNFHSIDIQNIKTTFQLPEIQFFESSKDITVGPPIAAPDPENKDTEKSKKPTERRGRKRQDGSLKVKEKEYKCKVCFTWFLTLGELNFHKLSHNPSPPPTCYMCVQRKFSSREQLRDHLREKHAKNKAGIWTCGMCLKEISDVWMYNEHLREHATQFARKGQTQGSMLGIPGTLMQETAVKNFITSIMQHRPSKANKESTKVQKAQEKPAVPDMPVGEGKTAAAERVEPKVQKSKNSNGTSEKPVEVVHKTDTPRNVEMHPNCKDPSRDCHHCGKQFPKPFKLQRHLVVHNLEKIFLCHKCPVSYQEAQELKDHLKTVHEEMEDFESKHTTLYTCELCADVMHVIKKSFICSTCNYTFSKKEQFDRHMEKHLLGGNKIFKFKGVLRPVKAATSKDNVTSDFPPGKKRKIMSECMQENSSDSGIASVGSLHLNPSSETPSSKSNVTVADDSTQTSTNVYRNDPQSTSVKTEDDVEEYPDPFGELDQCSFHNESSESESPQKEERYPSMLPALPVKEGCERPASELCDVKEEEDEVAGIPAEATSRRLASKENSDVGQERGREKPPSADSGTADAREKASESRCSVASSEDLPGSTRNPSVANNQTSEKSHIDQQRDDSQGKESYKPNGSNDGRQDNLSNSTEPQASSPTKDKASLMKTNEGCRTSTTRPSEPTQTIKGSSNGSDLIEDRESLRQQKKRKEMKSPCSSQRICSPATRENLDVDAKTKKKFRLNKSESPSSQKKPEGPSDYAVLSSVRDDVVSNKIISKSKTSNLGLQAKRGLLDNCLSKKAEIVAHVNGDCKAKKGTLGRCLQSPVSKGSSTPKNNSLNKPRPKIGVRSMESHSYRTAESQNHLLSQLFGQKLTSFKIPLRKDTSESMN